MLRGEQLAPGGGGGGGGGDGGGGGGCCIGTGTNVSAQTRRAEYGQQSDSARALRSKRLRSDQGRAPDAVHGRVRPDAIGAGDRRFGASRAHGKAGAACQRRRCGAVQLPDAGADPRRVAGLLCRESPEWISTRTDDGKNQVQKCREEGERSRTAGGRPGGGDGAAPAAASVDAPTTQPDHAHSPLQNRNMLLNHKAAT